MSAPDWLAALQAAAVDADALAALATGIDPEAEAPSPEALGEWWPECPEATRIEAEKRLQELADCIAGPEALAEWIIKPRRGMIAADLWTLGAPLAWLPALEPAGTRSKWYPALFGPAALSRWWLKARSRDGCPKHPLAPIVRAWINRPPEVRAETRPDPILPVVRVKVHEAPERTAGRLAFGAAETGRDLPEQLPLIEAPDAVRVPLLELCDWYGLPVLRTGGGRGAPYALAVYVSALLVAPVAGGVGERSIIATVRDLKEHLFPGRWQPSRDWPRIRAALIQADSLVLPEVYRTPSGHRQPWRAVALRTCPGEVWERGMLDAEIRLTVEHPPGAEGDGPVLDRAALAKLRAKSGPSYRAYIGAHSLVWKPGVTRVRHRGRWYWARDPARYPVLTAADRDRLAYASENDRRKRTRGEKDKAWEKLPGIRILNREADAPDGRRGWLIAPEGHGPPDSEG